MISVTDKPLSPETVIGQVRRPEFGCVATYVGLIRADNQSRNVATVEYRDPGDAVASLNAIAAEAEQRFPGTAVAISHRIGVLKVGDINLVVAVGAAHRGEGLAACGYVIDRFKEKLPTFKRETYLDGGVSESGASIP